MKLFMQKKQNKLIEEVISNKSVRTEITTCSHKWFFHTYGSEYVQHATAPFQDEFFRITEDESQKLVVLTAFRGSGKSTIFTTFYPIWAILGKPQKKFVVIISQTQAQVKLHLANLKRELESNHLLRQDLGPFEERNDEWSAGTLVLPKYNARIIALSMEQGVRGLRHRANRPDLIICDDLDDVASVKTKEARDKVYKWFLGDVIPAGDTDTRVFVVGNLLHEDSIMMRLKDKIEARTMDGAFYSFPIMDESGSPLWPGKFRSENDILTLKRKIGDEVTWQREYMLKIISDTDRVIHPEWLHYYDELPEPAPDVRLMGIYSGVDLAVSQKESADYTSIVTVMIYVIKREVKIFVLPNPINEHLTFPQVIERIKLLYQITHQEHKRNKIYVENIGFQQWLIEQLEMEYIPAEGVGLGGADKRSRIAFTGNHIQSGKILFPKKGCDELISQLVNFGSEKHDDLADAFSLVINKTQKIRPSPSLAECNKNVGGTIFGNVWAKVY